MRAQLATGAVWSLSPTPEGGYEQRLECGGQDVLREEAHAQALMDWLASADSPATWHGETPRGALQAMPGEQTNASFRAANAVWKCYRTVVPGDPPELTAARCGSAHVAASLGHVCVGDAVIATASRYIPGVDAWTVLQRDPDRVLRRLGDVGMALADVHARMGRATAWPANTMRERLVRRFDEFASTARQLEPYRHTILRTYAELTTPVGVRRVHGDLHFGQILLAGDNDAIVLVDFEGEPGQASELAPPEADLAGLIRSLHYAGVADVQQLLAGYRAGAAGANTEVIDATCLRAMVADRFAYEVAYEQQHRPQWVQRPLRTASWALS